MKRKHTDCSASNNEMDNAANDTDAPSGSSTTNNTSSTRSDHGEVRSSERHNFSETAAYDPQRVATVEQLQVFNMLVHPIWIFDSIDRRMRWANEAGLRMWSADSLQELRERNFSDVSQAAAQRMEDFVVKIKMGLNLSEQWTMYPKGKATTVHMNVSAIRLSHDEDHVSLLCEGIPVMNEDLVRKNIRGVEMLRHLPLAVCQFDMKGNCVFENPAATLSGVPAATAASAATASSKHDEIKMKDPPDQSESGSHDGSTQSAGSSSSSSSLQLQGRGLLERFVDQSVGRSLLMRAQSCPRCDIEAMLHTSKDGPQLFAIQIRKAQDAVTGEPALLYSAQDKSDAVLAQKERHAREQESEFLAIMAHEIRTPLHQVIGFLDLLKETQLQQDQKRYVDAMKTSAQGLMSVINDVLDYSKLEVGKMKPEYIPYEPQSVVKGSIEAVRADCEERNITLELEWDKNIPFRLLSDPNRLRQVLLNLLSNAVKFTPNDGNIQVKAETVEKRTNEIDRSMIKFSVIDTGVGISSEHIDVIFQKYRQADSSVARNFGGTGLGLPICRQLTHAMGGSMGAQSELGKGSTFWFLLPAEVAPPETEATETANDESSEDRPLKVLVVEDNRLNQKLMLNMLARLGHVADSALNGREAIQMIQNCAYDCVLMDIQMPVMDGLEATRRLRTMGYTELVIFGLTASVTRSDFADLGFNDWLPKPTTLKTLKAKLHALQESQ